MTPIRIVLTIAVAAILVPLAPQSAEAQVNPGVIGGRSKVAPPMMPTDTRTPAHAETAPHRIVR